MDKQQFSRLIKKYKRGECSSREKELLESYLETFQNNHFEWNEDEMGNERNTGERIYSEIMKNIDRGRNHYIQRVFFSPSLLKRAASIIFFLMLGTGILYVLGIFPPGAGSDVWKEKVTLSGEKSVITLSDGTKVILNADSKLKYPEQFNKTSREVYLEGEGYFAVYHNQAKPFMVHTGNLTTTDLGTKFDVSAYPENKAIAVSLLEGSVQVSRRERGRNDKIAVLKPKEKLQYDKGKKESTLGVFDSLEAVGWKDNIYKFENEPLGEVFSKLERAYGIKFRISDENVLGQKITVKFEKNSLQTVEDVIKSLTGLDYKIVKVNNDIKEILFFRNNK